MCVWHNRLILMIFLPYILHLNGVIDSFDWELYCFYIFNFHIYFILNFYICFILNFKMKFFETWSWKRTRNDLLHHPNEWLYLVFLALDFVLFVKCISKSFEVTNCHIQELFLKLNMKFFLKANILLHDFLERNVDFFFYFSLL